MDSSSHASRHRLIYFFLAAVTIVLGLVLRRIPLGLPQVVVKYGGSALWAAMVYWICCGTQAAWRPAEVGFVAGLIAALVEFFKLYHAPMPDAFRRTLAGALLLGRYFSVADIAVYWLAIAVVVWVDSRIIRRR